MDFIVTAESKLRIVRAARLWAAGWCVGDAWRESRERIVLVDEG